MSPFLNRVARWLVARRVGVQVVIGLLTVACALGIGQLRFELSPEALVGDDPGGAAEGSDPATGFAGDEPMLLVVFSGEDVLNDEALAYQHGIARWLESRPWAGRVDGLTTTPVPHRVSRSKPTLDALEAEGQVAAAGLGGPGDDPDDVALPLGSGATALGSLAAASPRRFPHGLSSILESWGDRPLEVSPLVAGASPTAGETDRVRAMVARGGIFTRSLVAGDLSAALIAAALTSGTKAEADAAVRELRAHLAENPAPEGLRVAPAGLPYMGARLVEALETDWEALIMLACFGSLAVLAFGFRSLAGLFLPMSAVGISLAIVTGAMGYLGLPIDLLTNVIPPLLITIGLGDAIHLLMRYREERNGGAAPLTAARRTMAAMAVACFMTSATTAVGFGSLIISETPALQRFGAIAAAAVMVAYLVTVIFLPSTLPIFPGEDRAHRRPRGGHTVDRLVERISSFATRKSVPVLVTATVLFAGCIAAASQVRIDDALLDQFDGSSEVRETTRIVEDVLGGVRSFYVVADGGPGGALTTDVLRELDVLGAELAHEEGVLRVTTPGDLLRQSWADITVRRGAPEEALDSDARISALAAVVRAGGSVHGTALDRLVTGDGRRARIEVRLEDRGIRQLNALFDRLEWRLGEQDIVAASITGEAFRASRGLDRVVTDLLGSLGLAVLIIFVLVGVLFRSPRLALVSVPPNVLPLAAVLGWMAFRGLSLNTATVIVFSVSIGLAVDGTIHVLSRFREEQHRHATAIDAVEAALCTSGRAVVLSSGAVLSGFLALQVSGFLPIRVFGELSMVAVVVALIAELTVLPALLVLTAQRGTKR